MENDESKTMLPPPEPHDGSEADGSVGHGKPPRRSRFQPGRSGNPKGRPPDAKGRKKIVEEIANEMHWVNEGGRRRRRSTLDLVVLLLRNRALDGNLKANRAFQRLLEKYGPQESQNGARYLFLREPMTEEEWEKEYSPEKDDDGKK